jgi:hypothetical protein
MLGNTTIPLEPSPNRRTARRLWHFCRNFVGISGGTIFIAWALLAPRATETKANNTLSLWIPNTPAAKTAALSWLKDVTLEEQAAASIIQQTTGPWTLIWAASGELVTVQTAEQHYGTFTPTNTRWLPVAPWHTGIVTLRTQDHAQRITYTYKGREEIVVNARLLHPSSTPTTNSTLVNLHFSANDQAGFWQWANIPLAFPGFRALAAKASASEASLIIENIDNSYETRFIANAAITDQEAESLAQDMVQGSDNISINNHNDAMIIEIEKNGIQNRVVRTAQSVSLTQQQPGTHPAPTGACRQHASARLNTAALGTVFPWLHTHKATPLIIETVGRKTVICRTPHVDNSH